ncbi:MAG TPA: glucose-6-phosphate dehydrogenase assembly protein OpcA [Candidatus Elarobacter sp.]|jgi:glucose-6-phosphate dehydrogenase assembly protein OpcA|nr:glucose-6-phosphate dehydrogenase assembly protein OpcA [Candidatus Elarobacter sp.]
MSLESSTVSSSIEAIRRELSRTKLSTSTLNLIVWIDDPGRRDWVLERAAMLNEKHPSFMLVFDHTGAHAGEATVTTAAHDTQAAFSVQGERVDVDVSGADATTVVGYVTALTSPSVPTVMWWTGINEASREIFYALLPFVQTLVFDSSGGARDESALCSLVAFHREHRDVVLRDLAWMRLRPWQDMIASFFDDDPDLVAEAYAIRKLHIASGSDSEAFYLAGWLASRLGWEATGPNAFTDGRGETVRFERGREGEIRRVQSVCLDSDTSWYHGEVTDDPGVVRVWSEGEHKREPRLFPLQAIDNASLLERAILEPGSDDLFETALRSTGTLLGC